MAKSPVKKTSPIAKKIAALIERVEALEGQSFAQQLLIDDLESQLEQVKNDFKNVWNTPLLQVPYGTTMLPLSTHMCQAGYPDIMGSATCITCGKLVYTVTTTIGTGIIGSTTVSSTETPPDDIDITWVEPWTLSDSKTKE